MEFQQDNDQELIAALALLEEEEKREQQLEQARRLREEYLAKATKLTKSSTLQFEEKTVNRKQLEELLNSVPQKTPPAPRTSEHYPVECEKDNCDKRFRNRSDMRTHVRKVHGPYKHKCGVCESAFRTTWERTRHRKTHEKGSCKALETPVPSEVTPNMVPTCFHTPVPDAARPTSPTDRQPMPESPTDRQPVQESFIGSSTDLDDVEARKRNREQWRLGIRHMKLALLLLQQSFRGSVYMMHRPATIDDLTILHKSGNYIVVNKHYDIKINSDDPTEDVTVSKQLAKKFPELIDSNVAHNFRFTHRLDYSTSGALCIALNKKASGAAQVLFMNRKVKKEYLALVRGHMQFDHVTVNKGIYPNTTEGSTHMMCYCDEDDDASRGEEVKQATTAITVLQRGFYDERPATKVRLTPLTGRRHQLRLHCLSIGHPIVGDYTYSNRTDTDPYRMMLHSYHLFIPSSIENINVTTPDPFCTELDPKWVVYPSVSAVTSIDTW